MQLDPSNVPDKYWFLIPFAEQWGISNGIIRDRLVEHASTDVLIDLVQKVAPYDEALDEWLAGPESKMRPTTIEYVAFSCLRLAVDMAKWHIKLRAG